MLSKKGARGSNLERLFLCSGIERYAAKSQGWRCGECPGMERADICSSATAPALPYYRPSMGICNICTPHVHVGRLKIAPCIFRTPAIHGGRVPQGAGPAVLLCPGTDGIPQRARMAVWLCLLYFSGLFLTSFPALANNACSSEHIDETTTIRYVHDGDTLHLRDGRKIRLIGINTPELAHKNQAAEPFAMSAKTALKALFKNNKTIALRYGEEKKDHYSRFLAHGFLTNGQNIQAILLNQGLASVINIPPNTQFSACYLEQEHKARCKKTGLWKQNKILQAKNIKKQHSGFHLVQGKVTNIRTDNKGIWLNIDHKLTIGIRTENQALFDIKLINDMINQLVTVRGWINKSKQSTPFYIRIRHPLSIQLSETHHCN